VVTVLSYKDEDFISITDMLKAKDGDFFISDGCETATPSSFWGSGNPSTTRILIMANSP